MDFRDFFTPYAAELDQYLDEYLMRRRQHFEKYDSLSLDLFSKLGTFIVGGKRLRGGLVKLAYEIYGGKGELILPISAAVEITHGAILIHDDIIDEDELRHGQATVHTLYKKFHSENYKKGQGARYGESMAMMVGDIGIYEAISLLSTSQFSAELRLKAIEQLCEGMIVTAIGEGLDVDVSYHGEIKESDVEKINTLKTSYYTFARPLLLGAICAGEPNQLPVLEKYALPIGLAYQHQDDILGIFGDSAKTGKSTNSDIKQGKNTLLYTHSIEVGTQEQRTRLGELWGKRGLTSSEAEEVKQIFVNSGALDYAKGVARKYTDKAKEAVPEITKDPELQEIMLTLADFVVERDK